MMWITIVAALITAFITWRRRAAQRLRHPILKGIPLPVIDDPRWVHTTTGRADLGTFHVIRVYKNSTTVLFHYEVYFEDQWIGDWKAYVDGVLIPLERQATAVLAERAFAIITGEKPKELEQPNGQAH